LLLGIREAVKDGRHWPAVEGSNKNQPLAVDSWQRHIGSGWWEIPTHSVSKFQADETTAGLAGWQLQDCYGMSDKSFCGAFFVNFCFLNHFFASEFL